MTRVREVVIISDGMIKNLKNDLLLLAGVLCLVSLSGCAGLMRKPAEPKGISGLPPFDGERAQLAIADFEIKTTKANNEIGTALHQLLSVSLVETGRFKVEKTGDLIISVSVVEFQPQGSGGSSGVGGGGSFASGELGGLLGNMTNKAHIAWDIRIVDAVTSKVLDAARIKAQAADNNLPVGLGPIGSLKLENILSEYNDAAMGKAIRLCLADTVRYIAQKTGQEYYKY